MIEGVQLDGAWVLAVLWHPEDTAADDPMRPRLLDALVPGAADRSASRR